MSVLEGPRRELRHVVFGGSAYWAEYREGELHLGDGRVLSERAVQHLPPCSPTKILCVHLNYRSRLYEFTGGDKPPPTPDLFPEAGHRAQRAWRRAGAAGRLQVPQL